MCRGLDRLEAAGVRLATLSSLWETEPVDLPPGPPVCNAAALATTGLAPLEILGLFRAVEEASGRRRGGDPWRSLDLDLLMLDDLRLRLPDLEIPHPRFHLRRFNLAPLAEIAPGALHPGLGRTIAGLLADCRDGSWVRIALRDWSGRPALHGPVPSGKIAALSDMVDNLGPAPAP